MKATVDRLGRTVVPKRIRDRHGLIPGRELEIEDNSDSIVLRMVSDLPGLVEKEGVLVFRGAARADIGGAVALHREARLRRREDLPA
jgi:AbrB family looped-hinge helix DNA binding protein